MVRPGHGLDGPAITSSWPAQPQADEVEDLRGLLARGRRRPIPAACSREDARPRHGPKVKRGIGRRRGRSNDHRLWLALLGVTSWPRPRIFGIIKFEFPSHGGPVHTLVTPAKIGTYVRTQNLEKQTQRGPAAGRGHQDELRPGQQRGVGGATSRVTRRPGTTSRSSCSSAATWLTPHAAARWPASTAVPGRQAGPRRVAGRPGLLRGGRHRHATQRRHVRLVRQRQLRRDLLAHHERPGPVGR